jgi:hypothetical protein
MMMMMKPEGEGKEKVPKREEVPKEEKQLKREEVPKDVNF